MLQTTKVAVDKLSHHKPQEILATQQMHAMLDCNAQTHPRRGISLRPCATQNLKVESKLQSEQQSQSDSNRDHSIINIVADIPIHHRNKSASHNYRKKLSSDAEIKLAKDVLIPRSVLRRHNPGNLVKDQRFLQATEQYREYLRDAKQSDVIGRYDALFGRQLKVSNPLLQTKQAFVQRQQLIQEKGTADCKQINTRPVSKDASET